MRRAVITGIGAVSCLGNSRDEITESLRAGRSGIGYNESYEEMGLRSRVSGSVDIDTKEHIDRKVLRFMGDAAAECLEYTSSAFSAEFNLNNKAD